jgi:hypothetical protein
MKLPGFKLRWWYWLVAGVIITLLVIIALAGHSSSPTISLSSTTSLSNLGTARAIVPSATSQGLPVTSPLTEPNGAYVRIKNVAQGTYIYETEQQAKYGNPDPADPAAQWALEDYQGTKRIRNRATGDYLAIEHQEEYVEAIAIEPVWMSPRWTFDSDPSAGPTIIRNVWHNWEVLYTEAGGDSLRHGRIPANSEAARWVIETVSGGPIIKSTATSMVSLPSPSFAAGSRGAAVAWIEYEAEDGTVVGQRIGPDRTFGSPAAEASGRRAVQLNAIGDYVQFTSKEEANSIVVRFVIPDAPDGGGITATLSLYVNGSFVRKLSLTSRYAWSYGGEAFTFNQPAAKGAHHYFDETRALVTDIPPGARVKLQKDAEDTAAYYVIDLVDLEQVDPPKTMPPGYLSITSDCGAVPDDGLDDGPAIQDCINRARLQGTGVWIPSGTFESISVPFQVADVFLQGAGMWYSAIHGFYARFNCTGNNCRYADFAILGETVLRDDQSPENGFNGGAGTGSSLENIWVEHTKVGYWVGPGSTNGLIIRNSRFRDLFADGVNFNDGASNSLVENSHFRNTGDDALASWSNSTTGGVNTNNVFRFNTVQVPWRANCFAIYGGKDNKIEDNLCSDVVTYPGILIAQSFRSAPFSGTTGVQRNSLFRAGGPMFNQEHGALKIRAEQGEIAKVLFKDILIDSATFSGIEIQGSYALHGIIFENIQIGHPGTWGIFIHSDVTGEVTFTNVAVTKPGKEGLLNYAPKLKFTISKGQGDSGW